MNIQQEIAAWDGSSAEKIGTVYRSFNQHEHFIETIIELIDNRALQKGATWFLKRWLESDNRLETSQIHTIYSTLNSLEHWETKLHILQSMTYMPIEKRDVEIVRAFLQEMANDSNKFVRAWTYSGFHALADQYPEYIEETVELFNTAMQHEAASVKARIRNLIKLGFH